MKVWPSWRNQLPVGSMTSGQPGSGSRQEMTYTMRLRGTMGMSMPRNPATLPDHGPAVTQAVSQSSTSPLPNSTPVTRAPLRRKPVHSSAT